MEVEEKKEEKKEIEKKEHVKLPESPKKEEKLVANSHPVANNSSQPAKPESPKGALKDKPTEINAPPPVKTVENGDKKLDSV